MRICPPLPHRRNLKVKCPANGCKLPPLSVWEAVHRFNGPIILGYSSTSFPPPADWELYDYAITGPWVLSADDLPAKPEAALVQFIEASKEPPLYIGWGSMAHESGQFMSELAVRALHAIDKRGLIFEGIVTLTLTLTLTLILNLTLTLTQVALTLTLILIQAL